MTENRNLFDASEGPFSSTFFKGRETARAVRNAELVNSGEGKQMEARGWEERETAGSDRNTSCAGQAGYRERKSGAGNDAKRDWTQTEIGGSGRRSEIAGVEMRGAERQMRYRHRNRHEMRKGGRKNCRGR